MLGLIKAALLFVPALAAALRAVPSSKAPAPNALITLDFSGNLDVVAPQETTLELRILESTTPCGYGNITLNEESLAQDDIGFGSGSFVTESGNVLVANWKFTCVHLEQDLQVQLVTFHIISVDGREIGDVTFSVQFQQTAPVSISYVDGAAAIIQTSSLISPSEPTAPENGRPSLENELAELESLKEQLFTLERSVALKIEHISKTFKFERPEELLQVADCDSLKCILRTMYVRVKGMIASRPEKPHWSFAHHGEGHGDQHHPWFPPHHGRRPLGNNSPDNEHQRPPLEIDGSTQDLDNLPSQIRPEDIEMGFNDKGWAERPLFINHHAAGRRPHQPDRPLIDNAPHRGLRIVAIFILMNIIITVLIIQCVRRLRQRRQAKWDQRRRRLREARDACNAHGTMVATKYLGLIQWLKDCVKRQSLEDEEKDAILRRLHVPDSEEEDALSTTMEEEIAQFRAAAGVVSDLVAAEEGRGRVYEHRPMARRRRASTPSSVASACPTYTSVDEALPTYDESHHLPEYVVDGLRYTPGQSTTDDSSTTHSSLDENLGRKD
ncbi:hypothetical protein F5Y19DRAFT_456779 [Xylariaceae sp. FL1651]|nr:hypothetical protein F5Y19DRAFT_456779 [Xylariaceae sp. FL1651]